MPSMRPKELKRRARVEILMLNRWKNPIQVEPRAPKRRIRSSSLREMSPKQERHTWSKQMAIATTLWATASMELRLIKMTKVARQVPPPERRAPPTTRAPFGHLSMLQLPRIMQRLKKGKRRENVENQKWLNELEN